MMHSKPQTQQPINLLPASYRHRVRRSWRNRRQGALLVALIVVLGGWWFVQQHHTGQMQHNARDLEQQVVEARQRMSELMTLRRTHENLLHQVRVQRLLAEPLRRTHVIATLGQRMPEAVTLTRLRLDTDRPATPAAVSSDAGGTGPSEAHRVRLELQALAPDDMTVADLLSALKAHPLFDDVAMHQSRPVEVYDVAGREFRLTTVIDLTQAFDAASRDPAPTPRDRSRAATARQEVAHAD